MTTTSQQPDGNRSPTSEDEQEQQPKGVRRVLAWVGVAVLAGAASTLTGLSEDAIGWGVDAVRAPFTDDKPAAPISVRIEQADPYDNCLNQEGMVFPGSINDLSGFGKVHAGPKPPVTTEKQQQSLRHRRAWDAAHGAIPSDMTTIYVHVQGKSDQSVTLTGLSINVRETEDAPSGVRMTYTPGGCGDDNESRFAVQTDRRSPRVSFITGRSDSGAKRIEGFPVRVTTQDTENLELVAYSLHKDTRFTFSLNWVSGDRAGSYEIAADDGQPFEVTSSKNAKTYSYTSWENNKVAPDPSKTWDGTIPYAARRH
ncbi:hypothetical protein [Streptomyces cadmiisoli]|uniref:hypothetical protein n=1 Tax=Streptomyces cadmiisoli TaxID=2184053 RepID=UPI003D76450D